MENNDIAKIMAPPEVMELMQQLHTIATAKGYYTKGMAVKLVAIAKRYQVCTQCGKGLAGSRQWSRVFGHDILGEEIHIGYKPKCYHCEISEVITDPEVVMDLWCYNR